MRLALSIAGTTTDILLGEYLLDTSEGYKNIFRFKSTFHSSPPGTARSMRPTT